MQSLTDVGAVRSAGSLASPPVANAVTDKQLQSAIRLAAQRMQTLLGDQYEEVADFDEIDLADADNKDKYDKFVQAECCFVIAELPGILTNVQLVASGLVSVIETKDKKTVLASVEEGQKATRNWEQAAYKWLAPFLTADTKNASGKTTHFQSKRKSFFMTSIGK